MIIIKVFILNIIIYMCVSIRLFNVVEWNDCYLPTLIQILTSDIMNFDTLIYCYINFKFCEL